MTIIYSILIVVDCVKLKNRVLKEILEFGFLANEFAARMTNCALRGIEGGGGAFVSLRLGG